MRGKLYYSGETINVGLNWTDLSKETVDVSKAEDIRVLLVHRPFKKTVATYSKKDGTMLVNEDKCLVTISSDVTKDCVGLHDIVIEITLNGATQKAMSDVAIDFVKPNNE